MAGMVTKLGSLAKKRLIISFAPKTWYYDILKKVRFFAFASCLPRPPFFVKLGRCFGSRIPFKQSIDNHHAHQKHQQIGELFPGPSKTTRAYLHTEEDVRKALKAAGFTVKRTTMTGTNFYFSMCLEVSFLDGRSGGFGVGIVHRVKRGVKRSWKKRPESDRPINPKPMC